MNAPHPNPSPRPTHTQHSETDTKSDFVTSFSGYYHSLTGKLAHLLPNSGMSVFGQKIDNVEDQLSEFQPGYWKLIFKKNICHIHLVPILAN